MLDLNTSLVSSTLLLGHGGKCSKVLDVGRHKGVLLGRGEIDLRESLASKLREVELAEGVDERPGNSLNRRVELSGRNAISLELDAFSLELGELGSKSRALLLDIVEGVTLAVAADFIHAKDRNDGITLNARVVHTALAVLGVVADVILGDLTSNTASVSDDLLELTVPVLEAEVADTREGPDTVLHAGVNAVEEGKNVILVELASSTGSSSPRLEDVFKVDRDGLVLNDGWLLEFGEATVDVIALAGDLGIDLVEDLLEINLASGKIILELLDEAVGLDLVL